jgi:hypothetical protein
MSPEQRRQAAKALRDAADRVSGEPS